MQMAINPAVYCLCSQESAEIDSPHANLSTDRKGLPLRASNGDVRPVLPPHTLTGNDWGELSPQDSTGSADRVLPAQSSSGNTSTLLQYSAVNQAVSLFNSFNIVLTLAGTLYFAIFDGTGGGATPLAFPN